MLQSVIDSINCDIHVTPLPLSPSTLSILWSINNMPITLLAWNIITFLHLKVTRSNHTQNHNQSVCDMKSGQLWRSEKSNSKSHHASAYINTFHCNVVKSLAIIMFQDKTFSIIQFNFHFILYVIH